jgi:hypothetical protein
MSLAETEFARVLDQLHGLSEDDWRQPTACDLWDVRAMGSHVLGMAEAQASIRQFAHDYRSASKRSSGKMIDAMTATQVAERASMTPEEIVSRLAVVAPKAIRARRRTPALVRHAVRMKTDPPFEAEKWRFGYLVDKISLTTSSTNGVDAMVSRSRSPSPATREVTGRSEMRANVLSSMLSTSV